jgi:phosphoribosyl-ATP pyrophosphohydrolase
MNEFISLLFEAEIKTHIFHLQVKLYSQHIALGDFYEGVGDLADKIAEHYQGQTQIIKGYKISVDDEGDSITYIKDLVTKIEANRYTWCDKSNTSLQNIIDEIVDLCYSTLYKLTNLR